MNSLSASAESKSNLLVAPCDFGISYQFSSAECSIELKNSGDSPIEISDAKPKNPSDSISPASVSVPPKGVVYLKAKVNVGSNEGLSRFYFSFRTSESDKYTRGAEIKGFVYNVLDQSRPEMDFGIMDYRSREKQQVHLTSKENPNFKLVDVVSKPDFLDVEVHPESGTVSARLNSKVPLGVLPNEKIHVRIAGTEQTQVAIGLKGSIRGDVLPSADPYHFGVVRSNAPGHALIKLSGKDGKEIKIKSVSIDGFLGKAKAVKCLPPKPDCAMVEVEIGKDNRKGQIGGALNVDFVDLDKPLRVNMWGVMLSPETEVLDFDEEVKKQEAKANASSASTVNKGPDIGSLLRSVVDQQTDAPPAGNGPLIRWSANNEELVFGYIIYRSTKNEGPFFRASKDIILKRGGSGSGVSSYAWRDTGVSTDDGYWYYIESINNDGSRTVLSSPKKVLSHKGGESG